jgi:hypothetical protein
VFSQGTPAPSPNVQRDRAAFEEKDDYRLFTIEGVVPVEVLGASVTG